MIFDSDKMCAENFHGASANGTLNHFHPRNVNGLVDPLSFSAINFLRTYNRLVAPNDIAQCYNLTLLKDSRSPRNIPLPLPPLPIQSILATTPINNTLTSPIASTTSTNFTDTTLQHSTIGKADFNSLSNTRLQSPPNRTVSSTCPSTPTEPTSVTIPPLNHPLSTLTVNLSPNFMRRQRGEKRPIPDEQKDEKYYERRKRNNEAAKKSRDARKMREDRVAFRAAMLEQENAILRAQLLAQREEISTLRQLLCTRA